jgi:hypothetical protein
MNNVQGRIRSGRPAAQSFDQRIGRVQGQIDDDRIESPHHRQPETVQDIGGPQVFVSPMRGFVRQAVEQ